jgi:1,4-dihydroxy-2-naphthoyl-CoA hydrolase
MAQIGSLPGFLGFDWVDARQEFVQGRCKIEKHHLAPTGYLHAATVVALADSACGFGCLASLPDGSSGFTTAELKANFIGTAQDGAVICEAILVHRGRTTQVWERQCKDRDRRDDNRPVSMHADYSLSAAVPLGRYGPASRNARCARHPRGPSRLANHLGAQMILDAKRARSGIFYGWFVVAQAFTVTPIGFGSAIRRSPPSSNTMPPPCMNI